MEDNWDNDTTTAAPASGFGTNNNTDLNNNAPSGESKGFGGFGGNKSVGFGGNSGERRSFGDRK